MIHGRTSNRTSDLSVWCHYCILAFKQVLLVGVLEICRESHAYMGIFSVAAVSMSWMTSGFTLS